MRAEQLVLDTFRNPYLVFDRNIFDNDRSEAYMYACMYEKGNVIHMFWL